MESKIKTVAKPGIASPLERSCNRLARNIIISLLSQMKMGRLEMIMEDGSTVSFGNGSGDVSGSIRVHDDSMFMRCLLFADLGLAESYLDGLCDFSSIRDVMSWFLLNQDQSPVLNESPRGSLLLNSFGQLNKVFHRLRRNSVQNSRRNIADHYDLGNEFFSLFLDESMTYSSALFTEPGLTLAQAQRAKFERIAQQLRVTSTDRVLDLGCGWGGLSVFLAKNFGCSVVSATISQQQYDYVQQLIRREGVDHLVELRLQDYRRLEGKFDRIVSIEMIEAVGEEYIDTFVRQLDRLLAANGILLMQMITNPDSRYDVALANVDFIQKHIFPGSMLQSLYRVSSAMKSCGDLFMVDLFDMTPSYVTTLRRWQDSFEGNLAQVRAQGFDERFIRKWRYYFEYCQAGFDMRNVSVVQATYSRPNNRALNGGH